MADRDWCGYVGPFTYEQGDGNHAWDVRGDDGDYVITLSTQDEAVLFCSCLNLAWLADHPKGAEK